VAFHITLYVPDIVQALEGKEPLAAADHGGISIRAISEGMPEKIIKPSYNSSRQAS